MGQQLNAAAGGRAPAAAARGRARRTLNWYGVARAGDNGGLVAADQRGPLLQLFFRRDCRWARPAARADGFCGCCGSMVVRYPSCHLDE
jgi:hypothetical protein